LFLLGWSGAGSLELVMNWCFALPRRKVSGGLVLNWLKHLDSLLPPSSSSLWMAVKACFSALLLLYCFLCHGVFFSRILVFFAWDFWNAGKMNETNLCNSDFVFFALTSLFANFSSSLTWICRTFSYLRTLIEQRSSLYSAWLALETVIRSWL